MSVISFYVLFLINAGSNASKVARARLDAAKKAAEEGKGGGGAKGMAERLGGGGQRQCSICKAPFQANQPRLQLQHHVDSKVGTVPSWEAASKPTTFPVFYPFSFPSLTQTHSPSFQHSKDTFEKCFPDFPASL